MNKNYNLVFDDRDDKVIGFYGDLQKYLKDQATEALSVDDYETANEMCSDLEEMEQWKLYTELLTITNNNGMGFTCKPYKGE